MTEMQVTLQYRSLPARLLLYVMLTFIPLWGVISPLAVAALIFYWIIGSVKLLLYDPLLWVLGFGGGLVAFSAVSAIACIALADNRLVASKDGLRIPCHASIWTFFRRDFRWDEISSVLFSGNLIDASRNFDIIFKTKSGLQFALSARRLSESELEKFLLAIELWCENVSVA